MPILARPIACCLPERGVDDAASQAAGATVVEAHRNTFNAIRDRDAETAEKGYAAHGDFGPAMNWASRYGKAVHPPTPG